MVRFGTVDRFTAVLDVVVSVLAAFLELILLFLVLKKGLHKKLILFTIYFSLLAPWDLIGFSVRHTPIFNTHGWSYFYWTSQFVFSILRLCAIAELCWRSLHDYPAVWSLAWRFLAGAATLLLLLTINSAVHNVHVFRAFISHGLQWFEFMQAVLLIAILSIGAYYRLVVPSLYRWMLAGLGLYSAVLVTNYQLALGTKYPPKSIFDFVFRLSYCVTLTLWIWGIYRWAEVSTQPPALIPQRTYDDLSPQVHDRLRELNDRLAHLLGSRRG